MGLFRTKKSAKEAKRKESSGFNVISGSAQEQQRSFSVTNSHADDKDLTINTNLRAFSDNSPIEHAQVRLLDNSSTNSRRPRSPILRPKDSIPDFSTERHTARAGGILSSPIVSEIEPLSASTKDIVWENVSFDFPTPFPRSGFACSSSAGHNNQIYLFGGLDLNEEPANDTWILDISSVRAIPLQITGEIPSARVGHTAVLVGNAFIVFGGICKIADECFLDDNLYMFNLNTFQWQRSKVKGQRPSGRYGHSLNLMGVYIILFGGKNEEKCFNDLYFFDLNSLSRGDSRWDNIYLYTKLAPPARHSHSAVSNASQLIIFGGTNNKVLFNDVWAFDLKYRSWSMISCTGDIPAPVEGHAACLINETMYIYGGRTQEGEAVEAFYALKIKSGRWFDLSKLGFTPKARYGHKLCSLGQKVICLGGEIATESDHNVTDTYSFDTTLIRFEEPEDSASNRTGTAQAYVVVQPKAPHAIRSKTPSILSPNDSSIYRPRYNTMLNSKLPNGTQTKTVDRHEEVRELETPNSDQRASPTSKKSYEEKDSIIDREQRHQSLRNSISVPVLNRYYIESEPQDVLRSEKAEEPTITKGPMSTEHNTESLGQYSSKNLARQNAWLLAELAMATKQGYVISSPLDANQTMHLTRISNKLSENENTSSSAMQSLIYFRRHLDEIRSEYEKKMKELEFENKIAKIERDDALHESAFIKAKYDALLMNEEPSIRSSLLKEEGRKSLTQVKDLASLDEMKKKLSDSEEKLTRLSTDNQKLKQEIEDYEKSSEDKVSQIKNLEFNAETLNNRLEPLQKQYSEALFQLASFDKVIMGLQKRIMAMRSSTNSNNIRLSEAHNQLKAALTQMESFEAQADRQNEEIGEMIETLSNIEAPHMKSVYLTGSKEVKRPASFAGKTGVTETGIDSTRETSMERNEGLRIENDHLANKLREAENKIAILLTQVDKSVSDYRHRQSIISDDSFHHNPDRDSRAIEEFASELEQLRSNLLLTPIHPNPLN